MKSRWAAPRPKLDNAWQFSPVVAAAVRDPVGARAFLMALGDILHYPMEELGPLHVRQGKEEWQETLASATPHLLGLAARRMLVEEISGMREMPLPEAPEGRRPQSARKGVAMPIVKPSQGSGARLADGYYPAIITEITESTRDWPNRNDPTKMETVDQFVFQFLILDDEGVETTDEIRGYCRQAWSQRATLYKWASAVLGRRCPKPDEDFDTDRLLKRRCDIEIVNQKSAAGTEYSKVANLYPYRSMTADEEEELASSDPVVAG